MLLSVQGVYKKGEVLGRVTEGQGRVGCALGGLGAVEVVGSCRMAKKWSKVKRRAWQIGNYGCVSSLSYSFPLLSFLEGCARYEVSGRRNHGVRQGCDKVVMQHRNPCRESMSNNWPVALQDAILVGRRG